MQATLFPSAKAGFAWLSAALGFATGFLAVFGWQAGGYAARTSRPAIVERQTMAAPPVQPLSDAQGQQGRDATSAQDDALKAAEALTLQSREVEQALKKPMGRLEKFLQQCELKAVKSQQVGEPDGDTIVRVEVPPLSAAEVETFWQQAEEELQKLDPGLQPYFIARVQNMKAQFLDRRAQVGVLFVKQRAERVLGEPSVLYWFFETSQAAQYKLQDDGSISLPGGGQPAPGMAWFDPSTYKPPQRLKHLAGFKYN